MNEGADSLIIIEDLNGYVIHWKRPSIGLDNEKIFCDRIADTLIGDFYGHEGSVKLYYEKGRLILSVDPFSDFESIHNAAFVRIEQRTADHDTMNGEELIFSFKTDDDRQFILSKAQDDGFIRVRFKKSDSLLFSFPTDPNDSWNSFLYQYYLRGGGAENEGLDDNTLRFNTETYIYEVFDTYYAVTNQESIGFRILDLQGNLIEEVDGVLESRTGSLIRLRDSPIRTEEGKAIDAGIKEFPADELGVALVKNESFGPLKIGMKTYQVDDVIGRPDSILNQGYWQVDGGNHRAWIYEKISATLEFVTYTDNLSNYELEVLRIHKGSKLRTTKNIGIGSSIAEVLRAYEQAEKALSQENEHGIRLLFLGETQGMIFSFKDDKVFEIMLGNIIRN